MDINTALAELRSAIRQWGLARDTNDALHYASVIVDQTQAIDEWLTNGGFLPTDWERPVPFVPTHGEV